MMKIGLPISQHFDNVASDLLPLAGAVVARQERHLDARFKGKDILFHTNGFLDDAFDEGINNPRILGRLNQSAKMLSFDLGPSCRRVGYSDNGYVAEGATLTEDEILAVAEKKIANIRKYFKGMISVENLDYHPSGAYETVCAPEFISRFVERFNVGVTLDIGHANVTCHALKKDIFNYLGRLPLSKVKEVHVSRAIGDQDLHMLPEQEEYDILAFILERATVPYIVLEHYGDPQGIIEGNKNLVKFLKDRGIYEN